MAKRKKTRRTRRPKGYEGDVSANKKGLTQGDALCVLALVLLVVVSYFPATQAGFVWDDVIFTESEPVQDVGGLYRIWFSPSDIKGEAHYWPIVYSSFWLEHKLWGFAPVGYHIVNILLHLVNTLLLWRLMLRLSVSGAWMIAAVFAVHPLHVESVAWVIERKDVLSALFYLTAALAYLRFLASSRLAHYLLTLLLFVAGLLCKSIAVTLPASLLIYHWWKQGRVTSQDVLRMLPFFLMGLCIVVADVSFYASREALDLGYTIFERVLIAARALWFYFGKLVWPTELAVIYPHFDLADPLGWGYVLAACAVVVLLYCYRNRIGRGPLAGALFFAVGLSPVLGFIDYGYMQFSFVADRFQYLAGIGVMAVLIGGASQGVDKRGGAVRKGGLGIAVVILVLLGVQTYRQAGIYRDERTFFSHIVSLNPQARNAHLNLGSALGNLGLLEEALAASRTAVELRPASLKARLNLSKALLDLGRAEEALAAAQDAVVLKPKSAEAHYSVASAFIELQRFGEAEQALRRALQHNPRYAEAHSNLGAALVILARLDEAETHLRRALQLNPQYTGAFSNLSFLLMQQARYEDVVAVSRAFLQVRPDAVEGYANAAQALTKLGRSREAAQFSRRARALGIKN